MEVIDVDEIVKQVYGASERIFEPEELNPKYAPQFDDRLGSFRMLVTGKAGTGKTNLVVSAILKRQIKFEHLFLYARDPSQSKYQLLMMFVAELEDAWERQHGERKQFATVITDPKKFIPIDEIDRDTINLAIFDDMLSEKDHKLIVDYFIRGRHRNMNCIYLTQDYYETLPTIRKNCQYFAMFGVSSKNELIAFAKDHSLEYDFKEFKQIFQSATRQSPNFLLIDRRTKVDMLQIRKNWDQVLNERLEFEPIEDLQHRLISFHD